MSGDHNKNLKQTFYLALNDDAIAMLDSLKQKIRTLEQACELYEAALKAACPEGAKGEVFYNWNEARYLTGRPYLGGQKMSTPFDESELDVQSTLLMWKEAYKRVETKLDELESLAGRLALDLKRVLLDRDEWWDQAYETLQAYRDMMDRWHPQETVSPLGKD